MKEYIEFAPFRDAGIDGGFAIFRLRYIALHEERVRTKSFEYRSFLQVSHEDFGTLVNEELTRFGPQA